MNHGLIDQRSALSSELPSNAISIRKNHGSAWSPRASRLRKQPSQAQVDLEHIFHLWMGDETEPFNFTASLVTPRLLMIFCTHSPCWPSTRFASRHGRVVTQVKDFLSYWQLTRSLIDVFGDWQMPTSSSPHMRHGYWSKCYGMTGGVNVSHGCTANHWNISSPSFIIFINSFIQPH